MKQQIPIKDISNDIILEGMTDLQLMNKYNIPSALVLYKIFNRLVTLGNVELSELSDRFPAGWKVTPKEEPKEPEVSDSREIPRYMLFGEIEICDTTGKCYTNHKIKDISELGIRLSPIDTFVGDIREFRINPKFLEDVGIIEFTAECRWVNGSQAGFKITLISPSNMRELQKFIRLMCYEGF